MNMYVLSVECSIFMKNYPLTTVCFEPFHFFFSSPTHHPTRKGIQMKCFLLPAKKKHKKLKINTYMYFQHEAEALAKTV